ncbi:MAG TPA: endonuclease III domain-containing protein [Persephonella sp.]|uniref:Endonuclease III n=1 Tax=Persephonella marina (strain DSM 14350 / EX-H1) TaxID=123214 RepID=C0QT63_PERMH|nr:MULTISPECIES: endonuclease III domain-containing protein [Persephonella]ACO03805.1 endonuclease III [Persephonella marina EX-H1]HCB70503.1 endonuclease III domain-containing protein [Persephonella sp.]
MEESKILEIYRTLLDFFGYQNWWPVYSDNPFVEISFGAILTQNTSWKNVEKALKNLIDEDLVDLEKVSCIHEEKLQEIIKPAGFYKRKSRTLIEFSRRFKDIEKDKITRDLLLSVKGIGKETADSILLYALNRPYFVVDAYTRRVFSRIGFFDKNLSYDEIQELFEKNLPEDTDIYKEYHALIVELGKSFCRKKPLCKDCPLFANCKFRIYNV